MASPFVSHVFIHKVDTLTDQINEFEEGSLIFCKENHGLYIKLKGKVERFGGNDVIDSLINGSETNPLSAKQGAILFETKEDKTRVAELERNLRDLIDQITLTVIDSLDTESTGTETKKVLSAEQGKVLSDRIEEITLTTINNLEGTSDEDRIFKEVLSAEQGKILMDIINERTLTVINDLNGTTASEFISKQVLSAEQGKKLRELIKETNDRIDQWNAGQMVATIVQAIEKDDGTFITIFNSQYSSMIVRTAKYYSIFDGKSPDRSYIQGTGKFVTYVEDEGSREGPGGTGPGEEIAEPDIEP